MSRAETVVHMLNVWSDLVRALREVHALAEALPPLVDPINCEAERMAEMLLGKPDRPIMNDTEITPRGLMVASIEVKDFAAKALERIDQAAPPIVHALAKDAD